MQVLIYKDAATIAKAAAAIFAGEITKKKAPLSVWPPVPPLFPPIRSSSA